MAVLVNTTSRDQVGGVRLNDELKAEIFGTSATDVAIVTGMNMFILQQLSLYLAFSKGWTFSNAEAYVAARTTIVD